MGVVERGGEWRDCSPMMSCGQGRGGRCERLGPRGQGSELEQSVMCTRVGDEAEEGMVQSMRLLSLRSGSASCDAGRGEGGELSSRGQEGDMFFPRGLGGVVCVLGGRVEPLDRDDSELRRHSAC